MNVLMLTNVSFKILSLILNMTAAILRNAKTLMVRMIANALRVFVDVDSVTMAVLISMNAWKGLTNVTPTQLVKINLEHTHVNVSTVS